MTRRATFRQSEIKAAIAAADARGKVAVWTPAGIAFLDRDAVPVPPLAQEPDGGNSCDDAFGTGSG